VWKHGVPHGITKIGCARGLIPQSGAELIPQSGAELTLRNSQQREYGCAANASSPHAASAAELQRAPQANREAATQEAEAPGHAKRWQWHPGSWPPRIVSRARRRVGKPLHSLHATTQCRRAWTDKTLCGCGVRRGATQCTKSNRSHRNCCSGVVKFVARGGSRRHSDGRRALNSAIKRCSGCFSSTSRWALSAACAALWQRLS
jgi:hypothetical protein